MVRACQEELRKYVLFPIIRKLSKIKVVKAYLNTNICCWRLDNKIQPKIALESEACLYILASLERNILKSFSSDILIYKLKQIYILPFLDFCKLNLKIDDKIIAKAEILQTKLKLKGHDAIHLSFALKDKAQYFLTHDDEIITKTKIIKNIKVINPVNFQPNSILRL